MANLRIFLTFWVISVFILNDCHELSVHVLEFILVGHLKMVFKLMYFIIDLSRSRINLKTRLSESEIFCGMINIWHNVLMI